MERREGQEERGGEERGGEQEERGTGREGWREREREITWREQRLCEGLRLLVTATGVPIWFIFFPGANLADRVEARGRRPPTVAGGVLLRVGDEGGLR